jgi:XTP/dITP diphosphohydrolase
VPAVLRTARYRCVLVYLAAAEPERPLVAEGVWDGLIVDQPRGDGGFGYDPYFWLPDLGCTAAELPAAEKNRRSHRGLAMRRLRELLAGGA